MAGHVLRVKTLSFLQVAAGFIPQVANSCREQSGEATLIEEVETPLPMRSMRREW